MQQIPATDAYIPGKNSDQVKQGWERAPHRSLLRATGLTSEDFDKPFIAVCNSYTQIIAGHVHLDEVARYIKKYIRKAEEFVNSIGIPAQPRVVLEVNEELKKPAAGFDVASDIISRDVALSAKLLKIINSSLFGFGGKVESIHRALSLLGLKRFNSIILVHSKRGIVNQSCNTKNTSLSWNLKFYNFTFISFYFGIILH